MTVDTEQTEELHYKKVFDLLSSNTEEYDNFINFLEKEVIPTLPSHEHFLDIGAGSGNLTKPISRHFERGIVIEPNQRFFEELMRWSEEQEIRLKGYNQAWQEVELAEAVELILISHVLYYTPLNQHFDFINKAYAVLRPGGKMIVALNGMQSDIWKLEQLLYSPENFRELPFAERLFVHLQQWGIPAFFRPYEAHIETRSEEEMALLIDFLTLDRIVYDDPAKIVLRENYLQQHLRKANGYSIASSGGYIVISKPLDIQ